MTEIITAILTRNIFKKNASLIKLDGSLSGNPVNPQVLNQLLGISQRNSAQYIAVPWMQGSEIRFRHQWRWRMLLLLQGCFMCIYIYIRSTFRYIYIYVCTHAFFYIHIHTIYIYMCIHIYCIYMDILALYCNRSKEDDCPKAFFYPVRMLKASHTALAICWTLT